MRSPVAVLFVCGTDPFSVEPDVIGVGPDGLVSGIAAG
jgi:hypothetical protein